MSRFGEDTDEQVHVKQIDPPDLTEIIEIPRDDSFIIFNPKHAVVAGKLTEIFIGKAQFIRLL